MVYYRHPGLWRVLGWVGSTRRYVASARAGRAGRVSTYKQSGMDRFVCQIGIASSLIVSLLNTELVESTPILHPEPQSNSPQHPGRWRPFTNSNGAQLYKYDNAFGTLFG